MLTDNLQGALLLSFVNLSIVFLILGFLGVLVKGIGFFGPKKEEALGNVRITREDGETVIEPQVVAAIMGALIVYFQESQQGVFLRDDRGGRGPWGKPRFASFRSPKRQSLRRDINR